MFWMTLALEPFGPLVTPAPLVGTVPALLPAPLTPPARVMPGRKAPGWASVTV
jgi:hypothetical protein